MPDTAASGPPSAGISRDEAAHLARLARLALDDGELDALAAQLDVILSAVAAIQEVADAADVPPTSHAVPLENVLRPDEVRPSLPRDLVLAAAPQAEDGRFRVPRILDDEAVGGDAVGGDTVGGDA